MSATAESQAPERPPTIGQRLLSPIAEVRREEVMSVMLMTLLMLLILGAYYELKTAREVFILSEGGAEVKSYSSAGQASCSCSSCPPTVRLPHGSIACSWCSG